jgi:hypothetical protein
MKEKMHEKLSENGEVEVSNKWQNYWWHSASVEWRHFFPTLLACEVAIQQRIMLLKEAILRTSIPRLQENTHKPSRTIFFKGQEVL